MNFDFTYDEVNLILAGLGELPAKQSINMILKVQTTAQQQMQSVPDETVTKKIETNESQKS